MSKNTISAIVWGGTFLVYFLPFLRWGQSLNWDFSSITALSLFPLFGLWAFAQMWFHYFVGAIKRRYPDDFNYTPWFRRSGDAVFVLILLHPALLAYEGLVNNFSGSDFSGERHFLLIVGFLALVGFLLYDLAEKLQSSNFWKKNWEVVKVISILAMLAIFYHSLELGQHLQAGWLRTVWIVMLIVFIGLVIDSYWFKRKTLNES